MELWIIIILTLFVLYQFMVGRNQAPFYDNIEKSTIENKNFRKVLYTTPTFQLVLMSLIPGEDIGDEVHHGITQFFRIEAGNGLITVEGDKFKVADGDIVVVPPGAKHNVINTGRERLQLYAIYSPPNHPEGTINRTKPKEHHH